MDYDTLDDDVEYVDGYGVSSSSDDEYLFSGERKLEEPEDLELIDKNERQALRSIKQQARREKQQSHQDKLNTEIMAERKLEEPEDLQLVENSKNVKEINQMNHSNPLSETQHVKLEENLQQFSQLVGSGRHSLTQSQFHKVQVYLGNIKQVKETLLQMLDNYLDDQEICENLLMLLDRINGPMSLYEELSESSENDNKIADFQNVLQMSQLVGEENLLGDEEFARRLQAEYDLELAAEGLNVIAQSPAGDPEPEPKPEPEPPKLPEHISELPQSVDWNINPFPIDLQFSTYNINSMFTLSQHRFQTWTSKNASVIQYVEIQITKLHPSFRIPFVLALWRNSNESNIGFTYQLLDKLSSCSIAILEHSTDNIPVASQIIKGNPIKEGDVLGVGLVQKDDQFLLLGSQNGQLLDIVLLKDSQWIDTSKFELAVQSTFQFLIVTGAVFKSPQLSFNVIDGKNESFRFDCNLPLEECSICFEEVLRTSMIQLEQCSHRFCYDCMNSYLKTALDTGNILVVQCPDMNCGKHLSDPDLNRSLSALEFGKFQQFRLLAHLRLQPNCRWCPTQDCQGGVVGDTNHPEFPKLICPECSTEYCFDCSQLWHPGLTCKNAAAQYKKTMGRREKRRKKKEENETKKWLRENKTVKCSKCHALVQRAEGCNHMSCRCGHEFCWLCGETINTSIGGTTFPLHYKTGACAGMQMSSEDSLSTTRKIARGILAPARAGVFVAALPVIGAKSAFDRIFH